MGGVYEAGGVEAMLSGFHSLSLAAQKKDNVVGLKQTWKPRLFHIRAHKLGMMRDHCRQSRDSTKLRKSLLMGMAVVCTVSNGTAG